MRRPSELQSHILGANAVANANTDAAKSRRGRHCRRRRWGGLGAKDRRAHAGGGGGGSEKTRQSAAATTAAAQRPYFDIYVYDGRAQSQNAEKTWYLSPTSVEVTTLQFPSISLSPRS